MDSAWGGRSLKARLQGGKESTPELADRQPCHMAVAETILTPNYNPHSSRATLTAIHSTTSALPICQGAKESREEASQKTQVQQKTEQE